MAHRSNTIGAMSLVKTTEASGTLRASARAVYRPTNIIVCSVSDRTAASLHETRWTNAPTAELTHSTSQLTVAPRRKNLGLRIDCTFPSEGPYALTWLSTVAAFITLKRSSWGLIRVPLYPILFESFRSI